MPQNFSKCIFSELFFIFSKLSFIFSNRSFSGFLVSSIPIQNLPVPTPTTEKLIFIKARTRRPDSRNLQNGTRFQ